MPKTKIFLLSLFVFGTTQSSTLAAEVPLESGNPNVFVSLSKKVVPSVVNISKVFFTKRQ
jgi:hypothetical protein